VRRIALLATAVLVPLIPAAPAYAADNVICVNGATPAGLTCNQDVATIPLAITAANGNSVDDTIFVGPGTYNDGPYNLDGTVHHVALQGSGQGSTFLTLTAGPGQTYLQADHTTVRDLTVTMNAVTSDGDTGIYAQNSVLDAVTVDGASTQNDIGMEVQDSMVSGSTVLLTRAGAADTDAIVGDGGNVITDSALVASFGFKHSAVVGDSLSRVTIGAYWEGIATDHGPITVDDALIDLGTANESIGLAAQNDNNGSFSKSITANHVTIVGGGTPSVGAGAYARASGALQQSTITLTNAIISGPETDLYVEATNDGAQGANSTATISTSYSRWSTQNVISGSNGTATLTSGAGHLTSAPGFRNAAGGDFRLSTTSTLIDKGAPGTGAPTLDLNKGARILDGNGDGVAVRDMGAYEAPKKAPDTTAPNTTITSHPKKTTTKRRVTFGFASTEAGSTFQCKIDKKPWRSCTSPKRYKVAVGWHKFKVRAIDRAGNVDATPAKFRFHRV